MKIIWHSLLLPLLLVFSGCAALQIDVDVYKGPLVNNEDIQKEQLLSMAMSAKPLLFGLRNRLLDEKATSLNTKDVSWRRRVLLVGEFDQLIADDPSNFKPRNARQINEILRSYDDLGDSSLQPRLDDLRTAEAGHRRRLEDYAARRRLEGQEETDESKRRYIDAWRSRVDVWAGMVALLREADRLRGSGLKPEVLDEILRLAAKKLSDLTDPQLLYCAFKDPRATSGSMQWLLQVLQSSPSSVQEFEQFRVDGATFARSRTALTELLRTQPKESIAGLLTAHQLMRTTHLNCEGVSSPRDTGIVRAPRKSWADDDASIELFELESKLAVLDSSGFDSGRIRDGLDTLSRRYAELRDQAVTAERQSERDAFRLREQAASQFRRLEHALVDFASRMQFLATSSWLMNPTDGEDAEVSRYKASLEVVGNSLVVHADDIRHRSRHRQDQQDAVGAERDAANAAFAPGGTVVLTNIERALREQHAEDRRRAAAAPDSKSSSSVLGAERQKKQDEKATLTGELRAVEDELRDLVALAVTLGLTKEVPDRRDLAKDSLTAWRADAAALDRALREPKDDASAEMLRAGAAAWLTQTLAGLTSQALRGSDRAQRLTAAQRSIERFDPLVTEPKLPRKSPLSVLQKVVRERDVKARAVDQERRDAIAKRTSEIKNLDTQIAAAEASEAAANAGFDETRFKAANDEIIAVRATVLERLDKVGASVDFSLARGFVILALQERAKAPDSKRAALDDAQTMLQRLSAVQGLPAIGARPDGGLPINVVDDLLARLNYRLLQEIATYGVDSVQARKTQDAIAQARKTREEKLYLRSSTAYLRSVYAATSLQNDPGLDWTNMLIENFKRWYKSDRSGARDVRADLDKANWQNINTVSVGASGGSNFVLAKDDVGNWYVKAMGADPAAMVRAAKNLALYNIGGRFNSDLLRVDDLRERLDQENDPTKRAEMRTEIGELSARGGRSAGGASSETLKLFEKHHADQAQLQHEALATDLADTGLEKTLRQRWQATLKGGNGVSAIDSAFTVEAVKAALDDARRALDNKTTPVPAPRATREVLVALLRANTGLKGVVMAAAELTSAERLAVTEAEGAVTVKAAAVKASQQQVDEATVELEKAQVALQSAKDGNDQAARDAASGRFDTARARYAAAAVLHKDNGKALTDAETVRREKTSALEAAVARQLKAAADVDDVYKKFVEEASKRRLRAIDETESALRIIGSRNESGGN